MHFFRLHIVVFLSVFSCLTPFLEALRTNAQEPLAVTHGIASGDVTSHSAIIWARANQQAYLHVEYDVVSTFSSPRSVPPSSATADSDYTAQVKLTGLQPDTTYHYRVWFSPGSEGVPAARSERLGGTFKTSPEADTSEPVRFVFGGDLGGQGFCRHVKHGYAIFSKMQELMPDFFIACGKQRPSRLPEPCSGWPRSPVPVCPV